jgi:hypothetical protein
MTPTLREAAQRLLAPDLFSEYRPFRDYAPVLSERLEALRAALANEPQAEPAVVKESLTVEQPGAVGLSDIECPPDPETVFRQLDLDAQIGALFARASEMAMAYGLRRPQAEKTRCANELKMALRAALAAAQPVAPGGLPIETALRKPAFVLVGHEEEGWVEQARWDGERREWWSVNTDWTDAHGSALHPTHWMPLPPPPAATQAQDKGGAK